MLRRGALNLRGPIVRRARPSFRRDARGGVPEQHQEQKLMKQRIAVASLLFLATPGWMAQVDQGIDAYAAAQAPARPSTITVSKGGVPTTDRKPDSPANRSPVQRTQIGDTATADGPTWDFANKALYEQWPRGRKGATWRDARDIAEGGTPYASMPMLAPPPNAYLTADVTALVRRLLVDNTGILVGGHPAVAGTQPAEPKFATRQNENAKRPLLHVVTTQGTYDVPVLVDTWTTVTSNSTLSESNYFSPPYGIVRFDLASIRGEMRRATLSLYPVGWYGAYVVDLYWLEMPELLTRPAEQHPELVQRGLAATVARDQDLASHPNVLVYGDFETPDKAAAAFNQGWIQGDIKSPVSSVLWRDYGIYALQVFNEPNRSTAVNSQVLMVDNPRARYHKRWMAKVGAAPEHLFMSYGIKVPDATQSWQGTKIPGAGGILGPAHYAHQDWSAGEKFDDNLGWGFSLEHYLPSPANAGVLALVVYIYDQDRPLSDPQRGAVWPTNAAFIPGKITWMEIEMKMNTLQRPGGPPNPDGIFRVWMDGVVVFENRKWKARGINRSQILTAIMLIMHGGDGKPNGRQDYEIARFIVSREYVGPPRRVN